jgi:L-ribulose-5-phosphate 4-epimerase
MAHRATPDRLIPVLSPRAEVALLARTLWREGYDDHLAGHITVAAGDGTLWCSPWLLTWEEVLPDDVIRIDLDGNRLEGEWPVPLGIPLHLAVHRARPDTSVIVHSHPLYGVVWGDVGQIPPRLDQSSALGGGELVLVDEYGGTVDDRSAADEVAATLGDADLALLAGHGVLVLAGSVRAAHQRAVALEQRCERAWHAAALTTGDLASPLPVSFLERMAASDGEGFIGFWEAAVRAELRADELLGAAVEAERH